MKIRKKVLIIGGAGFIGSHTANELFKNGYQIRILDNLCPRTHYGDWPEFLHSEFEKIKGDARNRNTMINALQGVDYVMDFKAYIDLLPDFSTFIDNNVTSTALLYELIVKYSLPIKKIITASSQFAYGEGRWNCPKHGIVFPQNRSINQLSGGIWDPDCPVCNGEITPLKNLESHQNPPNIYAISKYTQELITLKLGKLYGIPSVAMRYSIVHGPRQSLKNAYSGALRIFALKLLNDEAPVIYEDGKSQRDYVSIHDVARANLIVLQSDKADFENFNVGGGIKYTVLQLYQMVSDAMKKKIPPQIKGEYRVGDIRHSVSDISKLKALGWRPLHWEPATVEEYVSWLKKQHPDFRYLHKADRDLKNKGIIRKVNGNDN